MAYSGKQNCFTLWMVVQRFSTRLQPMQLPPHATGGRSLCTHRYALFYFFWHLQTEDQRSSNSQKSSLTCELNVCCWLFQFRAMWLMSCKLISFFLLIWAGMTQHIESTWDGNQSPIGTPGGGCAFGACIPKEPSGLGHGLHPTIGLVGPANSSLRMRE